MTYNVRVGSAAWMFAALVAFVACEGEVRPEQWHPIRTGIPYPLPEVVRTGVRNSPFDVPSIVLVVTVRQRWEIEETDTHGRSIDGLEPKPFFSAALADVQSVVRLNERRQTDPDLKRMRLVIDQKDRRQGTLRFELGRSYLLLLNPSAHPFYIDYGTSPAGYDSYVLAVPQGGFEIVDGHLRPLAAGGDLDAYAGRDANEVIKELQRK